MLLESDSKGTTQDFLFYLIEIFSGKEGVVALSLQLCS